MIPQPLVVLPVLFEVCEDDTTRAVIDAQREVGIRTAVQLLAAGNRGRAHYELVRSVRRQWRMACGGQLPIEPSPLPYERGQ